MIRISRVTGLALLLAASAASADDNPTTVDDVASDNGKKLSGMFMVKTPTILRVEPSGPVKTDPLIAVQNYDRILSLPAVDPQIRAEAMRRAAYLRVQKADGGVVNPVEVRRAIALYRQLLQEQPNDPGNDRAHYQLARALQLVGDNDAAIAQLELLGQRYPLSALTGDGVFRAAELLFARERYADAEKNYRVVLNLGRDSRFYEPAEYKYGWSQYKQGKYAETVTTFVGLLDRALPQGEPDDPRQALAGVAKNRVEVAQDALRVTSLSFAALGGGPAINAYFNKAAEPRFSTLLYQSTGQLLLDKQRYTDAAATYSAYIDRHPSGARAPAFQSQVIAAHQQGGFSGQVLKAKETYVERYAPGASYWAGQVPTPAVSDAVRTHLDDIGRHYQATAQALPAGDVAARRATFTTAANWYRRTLDLYPDHPQAGDINLRYADSLYDAGQTRLAAEQYAQTAYARSGFAKAPEAAYASVQAYQRLAGETTADAKPEALRASIAASTRLAETFPQHPQWVPALTRAAEDQYALKDYDQAIAVAGQVLASGKPVSAEQRRENLGVVADSRFAQQKYPEAEAAYAQLVKAMDPASPDRKLAVDQLAASVYKQAETARDAGDLKTAATTFLRVGQVAPEAGIRVNADYDTAAAYSQLQDWPAAQTTLEAFRARYPQHPLAADVDKKLALAYEKDNKPKPAADAYLRVAQRPAETPEVRRDAAWLAATLYDKSSSPALTSQTYEYYVTQFPQPLDRSLQARRRLADLARDNLHDTARYQRWLQEIVAADSSAGSARNDATKLMAAQASLEIGRGLAAQAKAMPLSLPIEKSIVQRNAATEAAVAALVRTAGYGFADVTTAATYELGAVYRDMGRAILASSRPAQLKGEALEQYDLLLEEQATPFEDKAIEVHEANLARMKQGLWNDWIHKSARALVELAPAKYGKNDRRESAYDTLL